MKARHDWHVLPGVAGRPGPVLVAGNLSLDDTINASGQTPNAPGGDALYAAIGARLWGAEVELVTLAGADYPESHLDQMRGLGLGTGRIRRVAGPTVHYRVTDDASGVRTYEHLTAAERLAATSPTEADFEGIVGVAWLHLAAMPIEAHAVGIAAARRLRIPVSVDPHEEYLVGYERLVRELVRGSAFMPSELEASLLYPDLAEDLAGPSFGFAAAAWIDDLEPFFTAIKLGRHGSVVRANGHSAHVAALDIPVVDLIGAGDAYCGGFVAGLLATGSVLAGAACGTVSAAQVSTQFGALRSTPWPSRDEMLGEASSLITGKYAGEGDWVRARLEESLQRQGEFAAPRAVPPERVPGA